MSETLRPNLSLPEAPPPPPPRPRGHFMAFLVLAALAAVLVMQYLLLTRPDAAPEQAAAPSAEWRNLAVKLTQRNLPAAATRAWQRHLDTLPATDREERGKTLYQIGGELMQGGDYEEAVSCFWQAENLLGFSNELSPQIVKRVSECLERLGKYDERDRELRQSATGGVLKDNAGEIAAEIGLKKMPMHWLEDQIARELELQLSWQLAVPPEQENEVKKQLLTQFEDPRKRLQRLYELVAQQLLYRRGLEMEIDKDPELQELLYRTKEQLIATAVVARELRDKIKPTQLDLTTYFSANREKFRTPPRATARMVPLADKDAAAKLLAQVKTEDDLKAAATRDGKDMSIVAERVAPQDPLPQIGELPALTKAMCAAKEPGLLPAPVEAGGAFFVVYVRAIEPSTLPEYEAVKAQVLNTYYQEKQRELQQMLVKELFAKYSAVVHDDVVLGRKPAAEAGDKAPAEDAKKPATAAPAAPAREDQK